MIERAIAAGAVDCLGRFDSNRLRIEGTMTPAPARSCQTRRRDCLGGSVRTACFRIIRVDDIDEAIGIVNACPYRLAASVFGPRREAEASCWPAASRLDCGQ